MLGVFFNLFKGCVRGEERVVRTILKQISINDERYQ